MSHVLALLLAPSSTPLPHLVEPGRGRRIALVVLGLAVIYIIYLGVRFGGGSRGNDNH